MIKIIGVILGLAGTVVLIGPDTLMSIKSQGFAVWGQLAVLGAAALYGVHAVLTRARHAADIVERTTGVCLVTAVICLVYAAVTSPIDITEISAPAWATAGALALFSTVIGYAVLYRLLQLASAGFLGYVNYLIPSFALVLGALVMGEVLTLKAHLGFALIMAGLAISEIGSRKAARQTSRTKT